MNAADVLRFRTVADIACSPDGSRVAFTVSHVDSAVDDYRNEIWIAPVTARDDLHPRPLVSGSKKDGAPRFSPDGEWIAFLSDREREKPQLYVVSASGGEPRRVTDLAHGAGPATWSPDASCIAFSARVATDGAPPADPDARKRWDARPRHITRAQYKADGQGYTFDARWQLFVVDVANGQVRQITSGDWDDRGEAWSPDATRLAWSRTRAGLTDYAQTDLWVGAADASNARRLTTRSARPQSPAWSPDGSALAYYAGDEPSPWIGDPMTRLWTVSSGGGDERCVTKDYDHGVVLLPPPAVTPPPVWSPDGATLTAAFAVRGDAHVVRARVGDGKVDTVIGGGRQVTYLACAAATALAYVSGDPRDPSEAFVAAWDGTQERRLTSLNDELVAELAAPIPQRRVFDTPNGKIEGWVIAPNGPLPAPLLVDIHGGPAGFAGDIFSLSYFFKYVLASRGWAVLSLNPTGSGSYGRAHAHGIRGRWGEHDLPEQLAAIDALVKDGIVDPARLAIAGYSYGGFMTSWTIGHTDRFKAAVVGAPVVDQESFFGTSDIGAWFAPWELNATFPKDRETLRRFSPISYVENVTTPTLILHGEADERCPIGQGEQYFAALLACGKAKTQFVRYPGGSHLFVTNGRPSHRADFARRVVDWMTAHIS